MYSGLVRESSFENHSTIDPELREFVSEAFDIFDLNNVTFILSLSLCVFEIYG